MNPILPYIVSTSLEWPKRAYYYVFGWIKVLIIKTTQQYILTEMLQTHSTEEPE